MSATFEDLRILKSAAEIADSVWKIVVQWDEFAKEVVGKQMARAAFLKQNTGSTAPRHAA